MSVTGPGVGTYVTIEKTHLRRIFDALVQRGYTLIGPTLGQGAVVYDEIRDVADLPIVSRDTQLDRPARSACEWRQLPGRPPGICGFSAVPTILVRRRSLTSITNGLGST